MKQRKIKKRMIFVMSFISLFFVACAVLAAVWRRKISSGTEISPEFALKVRQIEEENESLRKKLVKLKELMGENSKVPEEALVEEAEVMLYKAEVLNAEADYAGYLEWSLVEHYTKGGLAELVNEIPVILKLNEGADLGRLGREKMFSMEGKKKTKSEELLHFFSQRFSTKIQ